MKLNSKDVLKLAEIHLLIVTKGLGEIGGEIIPYPSAEYVRRNLLRRPVHPEHLWASNKYDRQPGYKGDKIWELLNHWKIEGLEVEGFESEKANPLESAVVSKGALVQFFQDNRYPVPAGLSLPLGMDHSTPDYDSLKERSCEDLETLTAAWRKFWMNAIYSDQSTWPAPRVVRRWLTANGFSERLASSGSTLISPKWARKGGRPNLNN